jgi:hypothetical protein
MSGIIGEVGSKSGVIGLPNGTGIEDNWSSNAGSSITAGTNCAIDSAELFKNNVTGMVCCYYQVGGFSVGATQVLATLPSGFIPKVTVYIPMICTNWDSLYPIRVYPVGHGQAGNCYIWNSDFIGTARSATNQKILFSASWFAG